MNKIIRVILIILISSCKSVSVNKEHFLSPKKGVIVFKKENKIFDTIKYGISIDSFSKKMKIALRKQILEERNDTEIDSTMLNQLVSFSKANIRQQYNQNDVIFKHHKFQDSVIIAYDEINNKVLGDYTLIYKNSSTFNKLAKKDSTTIYLNKNPYYYSNSENIISLKEDRKDIKKINDYNCFKVIVKVKENISNSEDNGYNSLMKNSIIKYELYVTDRIKSNFHPVFNYKTFLARYYPLEIKEYQNFIKGVSTNYTLVELSLK